MQMQLCWSARGGLTLSSVPAVSMGSAVAALQVQFFHSVLGSVKQKAC